MSGVNKVIIIGRLGKDPELKQVNSKSVVNMSVATSKKWKNKDGEDQERTEWHRIVVWGKSADACHKHLSKGQEVYVEGELQTRSWEDNGVKKYTTEIQAHSVQFLGVPSPTSSESKDGDCPF